MATLPKQFETVVLEHRQIIHDVAEKDRKFRALGSKLMTEFRTGSLGTVASDFSSVVASEGYPIRFAKTVSSEHNQAGVFAPHIHYYIDSTDPFAGERKRFPTLKLELKDDLKIHSNVKDSDDETLVMNVEPFDQEGAYNIFAAFLRECLAVLRRSS